MHTTIALRGWRSQKLRDAINDYRGSLEGLDGITVLAVAGVVESQLNQILKSGLCRYRFEVLKLVDEGEGLELVIVASFGTDANSAIEAALYLRDKLSDLLTDPTAASIALGRHLYSALKGIQQEVLPRIDLDTGIPGLESEQSLTKKGFAVFEPQQTLTELRKAMMKDCCESAI